MQNTQDIQEIGNKHGESALLVDNCNEKQPITFIQKKAQNNQEGVKKEETSNGSIPSTYSDGDNQKKAKQKPPQLPQKEYRTNQINNNSNDKSGNSGNEESSQKNEIPGNTSTNSKNMQSNSNKSQSSEKESGEDSSSSSYNNKKKKYQKKRNLMKKTYFKQDYQQKEEYAQVVKVKKNLWKNLAYAFFTHLSIGKIEVEPILVKLGVQNLKGFFLKYSLKRIVVHNRQNFFKYFYPTIKQLYDYNTCVKLQQEQLLSELIEQKHQQKIENDQQQEQEEGGDEEQGNQNIYQEQQQEGENTHKKVKLKQENKIEQKMCGYRDAYQILEYDEYNQYVYFKDYKQKFKDYEIKKSLLNEIYSSENQSSDQEQLKKQNNKINNANNNNHIQQEIIFKINNIKIEENKDQQQQIKENKNKNNNNNNINEQSLYSSSQYQNTKMCEFNSISGSGSDTQNGIRKSQRQRKKSIKNEIVYEKQIRKEKKKEPQTQNINDPQNILKRMDKLEHIMKEKQNLRILLFDFLRKHMFQFCTQKSKMENVYLFLKQRHNIQLEIHIQQQRNLIELMIQYEQEEQQEEINNQKQ